MEKPSQDKIDKLPVWAQDYIRSLERAWDASVKALNRFQDDQTISPIYVSTNECTGEKRGPSEKRHYLQADTIHIQMKKEPVIMIQHVPERNEIEVNCVPGVLKIKPSSTNSVVLTALDYDLNISNPDCDGSGPHSINPEVRVLPTGPQSNANFCRACYDREMEWRRMRNSRISDERGYGPVLADDAKFKLPDWESLKCSDDLT